MDEEGFLSTNYGKSAIGALLYNIIYYRRLAFGCIHTNMGLICPWSSWLLQRSLGELRGDQEEKGTRP